MAKMKTFVPAPYEGEHIMGTAARWLHLLGQSDKQIGFERLTHSNQALSGQYVYHPMMDFMQEAYSSEMKRRSLFLNHTLLPYYSASLRFTKLDLILNKRVDKGRMWKKEQSVKAVYPISAPGQTLTRHTSHWRWCPHCVQEDEIRVGIPYWHVRHQLPSAQTCYRHAGVLLLERCSQCEHEITDLRYGAMPPSNNVCKECNTSIQYSNIALNDNQYWVEQASFALQNDVGELSAHKYSHLMRRGIQAGFAKILNGRVNKSVFVAAQLQAEFKEWVFENGFDEFFSDPDLAVQSKILNIETALGNVNTWPPVSILLWLRFMRVAWPSAIQAA